MNKLKTGLILNIKIATLFLLFVGCSVPRPSSISDNDSSPIPITTQVDHEREQISSVTPEKTPIVTPSDVLLVPTASSLPAASTVETVSIPTPIGDRIVERILWLYETNNGCQLPCWWGIMPGQTEWVTAKELLEPHDNDIYQAPLSPGVVFYNISIPLPLEVFNQGSTQLAVLVKDGVVARIDTRVSIGDTPKEYLTSYLLSSFLIIYGPPSEIWLATSFAPFENSELPFNVVLFYPDLGLTALFFDNAIKQGDTVIGCPQEDPVKALTLWSPQKPLSFEEVKNGYGVYTTGLFLSLEESTNMDVTTFYETFKNSDNTTCLETPAELWR